MELRFFPINVFRETPKVTFFDAGINSSNGSDVVIHSGEAISPPDDLKDEKYYHECLVHPALSSIDKKSNVLIIGGGDGGTLRECVKYSLISKIDLVEIDEEVIKISKKFLKEIGGEAWNDKRLEIHVDDGV